MPRKERCGTWRRNRGDPLRLSLRRGSARAGDAAPRHPLPRAQPTDRPDPAPGKTGSGPGHEGQAGRQPDARSPGGGKEPPGHRGDGGGQGRSRPGGFPREPGGERTCRHRCSRRGAGSAQPRRRHQKLRPHPDACRHPPPGPDRRHYAGGGEGGGRRTRARRRRSCRQPGGRASKSGR